MLQCKVPLPHPDQHIALLVQILSMMQGNLAYWNVSAHGSTLVRATKLTFTGSLVRSAGVVAGLPDGLRRNWLRITPGELGLI